MSALAARRAAAIAAAAAPQQEINLNTEKTNGAGDDSASASGSGASDLVSEDSETSAASDEESIDIPVPSPKRRKTQKSRNPSPEPKKATRYFVATPETTSRSKGKGRASLSLAEKQTKRFSPSAPDSDDEVEEKEESVGDSDEDMAEDVYDEAAGDVDEGRVQWAQSNSAGSSRQKPQAVPETTSNFVPRENVNLLRLSKEALSAAGLEDEFVGPGMLVSLASDETLVIAGTYILTLLQRSLSLFSTTIHPSLTPHPVYAPTSHPLPTLSPSPTTSSPSALLSKLKLPKEYLKKNDRTILLVRENGCGIDGLRYGAVPGFSNAFLEEQGAWGLRNVHPVIGSFSTPVYSYHTPASWGTALTSSTELVHGEYAEEMPFVGLVKGQKRSGKSTFARGLLNTLLGKYERVAWLECDLGQGEFGCGGVVGLWVVERPVFVPGPPFTHPSTPVRAHYLGTYTPLTCPDEYISSIRLLLSHFKYELQFPSSSSNASTKNSNVLPLIVNTQGWVKGLGEELLRGIEVMAEPTHVYEFEAPVQDGFSAPGWTQSPLWSTTQLPYDPSNPTSGLESDVRGKKTYKLEAAPVSPLQARYTPSDFRVLSTLTYFYSSLPSNPSSIPSWDFSPLATVPPYQVLLSSVQEAALRKVYLIGEGSEGVVPEDIGLALNGAVVALVEESSADEEEEGVYVQGRLPPAGESTTTLGLALVRSISSSPSEHTLHLLTPLPPHLLSRANVIVKNGALELPLPGWLDSRAGGVREEGMWGRGWEEVPFLEVGGMAGVVGGERRRFRKNIMRKGQ
ncbi:hypothetical protein IAR50_002893 [Cryptococcus sp. DSM 104548]